MKKLLLLSLAAFFFCCGSAQRRTLFSTADYVLALKQATDVMVTDVTSPVAAARYYAYINLTATETAALFPGSQPPFAGLLKGMNAMTVGADLLEKSEPSLATILAVYKAARKLLPSGYLLQKNIDSLKEVAVARKLLPWKINGSLALADNVLEQVMKYVSADGFARLSGLRRFTPQTGDGFWQPTAPGFMSAVEPHWGTLRPFLLDSCSQFACPPPAPYSTDTASAFFRQLKEVYETTNNLTKEQEDIANFWDCNPFALQQIGHLEFGVKKISPGGHWMGITGIACKKQKLNLSRTAYIHALVSFALADAFIACWSAKYKYNRIRPVTAIRRLVDRNWNPLLQTPPFPEYASGHSVISASAATVLTHFFGGHFAFTDDTEVEFGIPARKFNSFADAANEAAISRLWGGIHFRDAIENGAAEGKKIGRFIITQMAVSGEGQKESSSAISTRQAAGRERQVFAGH